MPTTDIDGLLERATEAIHYADRTGVGVYACEAAHFASAPERAGDTVIVVLRGEAARTGRAALTTTANLIQQSVEGCAGR